MKKVVLFDEADVELLIKNVIILNGILYNSISKIEDKKIKNELQNAYNTVGEILNILNN